MGKQPHTAGPWRWEGGSERPYLRAPSKTPGGIDEFVLVAAHDYHSDRSSIECEDADARLIAAAPCLLEALSQLCENAELARFYIGNTEGGDIIASSLWDTIGQAQAAIAKATEPQS